MVNKYKKKRINKTLLVQILTEYEDEINKLIKEYPIEKPILCNRNSQTFQPVVTKIRPTNAPATSKS